jgi:hypothetical protein
MRNFTHYPFAMNGIFPNDDSRNINLDFGRKNQKNFGVSGTILRELHVKRLQDCYPQRCVGPTAYGLGLDSLFMAVGLPSAPLPLR